MHRLSQRIAMASARSLARSARVGAEASGRRAGESWLQGLAGVGLALDQMGKYASLSSTIQTTLSRSRLSGLR